MVQRIMTARGAGDSVYHCTVARSAGFGPCVCGSWGSASLHPRLYAIARSRGLGPPAVFLIAARSKGLKLTHYRLQLFDLPSLSLTCYAFQHRKSPFHFHFKRQRGNLTMKNRIISSILFAGALITLAIACTQAPSTNQNANSTATTTSAAIPAELKP